jgi:hypothetical protein
MRARWITAAVVTGLLAVPASALAGGWATVSLSSTPDGLKPGQPWLVELEILQHGKTPLDGVKPAVILTERKTGATRSVAARPTGRPGIYLARAVFPREGRWEYVVDDGFSQRHSYPPVTIGAPAPALPAPASRPIEAGGDFPWAALAAALAAGLAAAGLTLAVRRRRGREPIGGAVSSEG